MQHFGRQFLLLFLLLFVLMFYLLSAYYLQHVAKKPITQKAKTPKATKAENGEPKVTKATSKNRALPMEVQEKLPGK